MTYRQKASARLCIVALALPTLASGCRTLNPGFRPDSDEEELPDSSRAESTQTTSAEFQHPAPSTNPVPAASLSSEATTTSEDTDSSPPPDELRKSPFCADEHSLCYSMQENKAGFVIEEQEQDLHLIHDKTSVTSKDSELAPPWDQLLQIEKHGGSAQTKFEFSIPRHGILGVEILAKDLSCTLSTMGCPVVSIKDHLWIYYHSNGKIECEAKYQGQAIPGKAKIEVSVEGPASPLRAVCWSDGKSLKLWANGQFIEQKDTGGLLATKDSTQLVLAGWPIDFSYATAKGSIALLRIWSDVSKLREKLDANPEL